MNSIISKSEFVALAFAAMGLTACSKQTDNPCPDHFCSAAAQATLTDINRGGKARVSDIQYNGGFKYSTVQGKEKANLKHVIERLCDDQERPRPRFLVTLTIVNNKPLTLDCGGEHLPYCGLPGERDHNKQSQKQPTKPASKSSVIQALGSALAHGAAGMNL